MVFVRYQLLYEDSFDCEATAYTKSPTVVVVVVVAVALTLYFCLGVFDQFRLKITRLSFRERPARVSNIWTLHAEPILNSFWTTEDKGADLRLAVLLFIRVSYFLSQCDEVKLPG